MGNLSESMPTSHLGWIDNNITVSQQRNIMLWRAEKNCHTIRRCKTQQKTKIAIVGVVFSHVKLLSLDLYHHANISIKSSSKVEFISLQEAYGWMDVDTTISSTYEGFPMLSISLHAWWVNECCLPLTQVNAWNGGVKAHLTGDVARDILMQLSPGGSLMQGVSQSSMAGKAQY